MVKATAQQCHALTTYYISRYKEVFDKAPLANRNKARWGFEAMLMDYNTGSVRELIDYYIEHYERPTLDWFLFNYEKVDEAKQEFEEQKAIAAKRRQETAQRLDEWRKRWQK